jgi:hypothetical protein
MQFFIKVLFSIPFLYAVLYIWTHEIDVGKTLAPLTSFIKFAKYSTISVDFENILITRAAMQGPQSDNYVIVLYHMTFINTSDDNVTVQKILMRYQLDGKEETLDSPMIVNTGVIVDAPQGPTQTLRIAMAKFLPRSGYLNLMDWKNIGTVIGDNKLLLPGGVMNGSAVFSLKINNPKDLARLKNLQIIAVDYRGKEAIQDIPINSLWIEKAPLLALENRPFSMDKTENIKFLD